MLNSLFIILREVLEAAVIISLLLASIHKTRLNNSLLLWGGLAGLAGSILMASHFTSISDAFEGIGQELLNAVILFSISALLAFYLFLFIRYSQLTSNTERIIKLIILLIVFLAVMREGVEIIIYISGYFTNLSDNSSLIIGASIGAWIGISAGILIYYGLLYFPPKVRLNVIIFEAIILSAGKASEGILYLIQADWIESGLPLWDSSFIIEESSIIGQLLYATFAYEARPSGVQVAVYILTFISILLAVSYGKRLNKIALNKETISL